MSSELEKSVLRVLNAQGITCGAAFVVAPGLAVTCAHVVRNAGALPGGEIRLAFVQDEMIWHAQVDAATFNEALDAAFLHLENNFPCPPPLPLVPSAHCTGKTIRAVGFPITRKSSTWAVGKFLGTVQEQSGKILLQIDSKQLRAGFSGAPIWSEESNGVIGMQAEALNPQRLDLPADVAFALPVEELVSIHPGITLSSPHSVLAELFAVPCLPTHYLPRPTLLHELCDALLAEGLNLTGIQGMGGVGKSVLAQAVAREETIRRRFYDGIFWLHIGQKPARKDLHTRQMQVIRILGPSSPPFSDLQTGRQELGRLLKNRSCLLILDDVWHTGSIHSAFNFNSPASRLLLTTRDAAVLDALDAKGVIVDVLEEEEAVRLLCHELGCSKDALPAEVSEVARQVSCLPLGLRLCAGMARRGIPWKDILDALQEADIEFIDTSDNMLLSAIHTSVEALPESEKARYADLVVFSKGQAIPEADVTQLWKKTGELNRRDASKLVTRFKERHCCAGWKG